MNQLIAMSGEMTMTSLEFMEIINAEFEAWDRWFARSDVA